MALFRRSKSKSEDIAADSMPLDLPPAYGTEPINFSGKVVRSFRHMLTRMMRARPLPERIALVSALREEGVTYTSLALATTIASDWDKTVCVVELNWWWPGMVDQVPELESPGTAGVLMEGLTLDDVVVPTGLRNLFLLPAGEMDIEARPAAARSPALKNMIYELTHRYDHLILDIPAVLSTTDAIPLASLGNGCCVIVRQGVTSIQNVRQALDDLDHLPMLGVIMNQVQVHTPSLLLRFIPQE